MNPFVQFFVDLWQRIAITKEDDERTVYFKRSVYAIVGMMVVSTITAFSVFFIFLEGEEDVFVPNLIGVELNQALRALNEKNLYPVYREDLNRRDKESWGRVVAQDPPAGQVVKAGRRIVFTVGRPPIADRMPDFRGKPLSQVREEIFNFNQKFIQSGGSLSLTLREPLTYLRNNVPRLTVLQQSPAPGADLFEPTQITLVVSDGPSGLVIKVPNLVGKNFQDAMAQLEQLEAAYFFTVNPAAAGQTPGNVVAQSPQPNTEISSNSLVELVMARPTRLPSNQFFGVVELSLRAEAIPIRLTLLARSPNGETKVIAQMNHPGGQVRIPYITERGTELVLQRFSETIWTRTVISE